MLSNTSDPKQHFEAVEDLLTRWLKERRALLGVYTEIIVTLDYHLEDEAMEQRQHALCQPLERCWNPALCWKTSSSLAFTIGTDA